MASFDTVKSLFMGAMAITLFAMLAFFFNISVTIEAGYIDSMDPAYPYLQAVAMHQINSKPFLSYLSDAVNQNTEVVSGLDVKEELSKFDESFELINSNGDVVFTIENPKHDGVTNLKNAYLAVPLGGYLVMTYAWS